MTDKEFVDSVLKEYKKEYCEDKADDTYSKIRLLSAEIAARVYRICEKVSSNS